VFFISDSLVHVNVRDISIETSELADLKDDKHYTFNGVSKLKIAIELKVKNIDTKQIKQKKQSKLKIQKTRL